MSNTIIIKNREPQAISIKGGGEVLGITTVYVNGIDVTEGSVAYVIVPTKTSELTNDSGFISHEVDPTVPYYVKQITQADINSWNNKQDELVSGTNIKTINSNSLLGSGNIDISTSYTAGTGINISNENVISNTITSYNDLTDLPTIPTSTSELLNDSGYLVADDLANVAFSGSYADLSDVPDLSEYATLDTEDLENYYTKRFMWNILPKSTGSGTSVSLSDTIKDAPIELTLSPSALSQEATPTPDSPQDIHTISGSNKVVVCGKNLFDRNNNTYTQAEQEPSIAIALQNFKQTGRYAYGYISSHTEIQGNTAYRIAFIPLIEGVTYTVYNNSTDSGKNLASIIFVDNSGNIISRSSTWISTAYTHTVTSQEKYMMVSYGTQYKDYVQVEVGSTATTYEPYISQEADIDLSSKNLISVPEYYPVTAGPVVLDLKTPVPAGTYKISIKEFINGGTTKGLIHFLDSSNTQLTYTALDNTTKSATITVSSPIAKLRLYSQNSAGASTDITSTYVGLMLSTSGGEYQEYYEPIEYCKIGNYEDKIFKNIPAFSEYDSNLIEGEWYIKKNISKVVLDGTESWNYENGRFLLNFYITALDTSGRQPAYSNYFGYLSSGSADYGIFIYKASATNYQIYVYDKDYTTVSDFQTWLSTHNLTLYYILNTPTYTQITGTLAEQLENAYYNLTAYDNQTTITQTNNDLPFVISASTPKTLVNM